MATQGNARSTSNGIGRFSLGLCTRPDYTRKCHASYKVLKVESMSKWIVGIVMNFARKILNVGRGKCPIFVLQRCKVLNVRKVKCSASKENREKK